MMSIVVLILVFLVVMTIIGIFSLIEEYIAGGMAGSIIMLLVSGFIISVNPPVTEESIIKNTEVYSLDVQLSQGEIELAKLIKKSGGTPTYVCMNIKTTKDGNKPNFWTWPFKRYNIDNIYWIVQK